MTGAGAVTVLHPVERLLPSGIAESWESRNEECVVLARPVRYRALLLRRSRHAQPPRRGATVPPLAIFLDHSVVRRPLEVEDFCFIREEEFRHQLHALRRRLRLVSLE